MLSIEQVDSKINNLIGGRDLILKDINSIEVQLNNLSREKRNIESAQVVVQDVAKQTQDELSYRISDIVTTALDAVYDDPYEFAIDYNLKRGKTEANLLFKLGDEKIEPMEAAGGGVVDIASFALRIALWNLIRPKAANTIILDEPFRYLGSLQSSAGKLLKMLSDKLDIQFIIVSHDKAIIDFADKVFEGKKIRKVCHVKEK